MRTPRSTSSALLLAVACLLLAAGCGSGSSSDVPKRSTPKLAPAAGTGGAARAKTNTSVFVETPDLIACMQAAGFVQDAPPTGSIKAWRGPNGARAAVASGPDETRGIAAEIATPDGPATVDGTHVLSGPPAQVAAARDCLA